MPLQSTCIIAIFTSCTVHHNDLFLFICILLCKSLIMYRVRWLFIEIMEIPLSFNCFMRHSIHIIVYYYLVTRPGLFWLVNYLNTKLIHTLIIGIDFNFQKLMSSSEPYEITSVIMIFLCTSKLMDLLVLMIGWLTAPQIYDCNYFQ
jgi:hypothetical protein